MKTPLRIALVLCSLHAFALAARAGQKDKTLDVYWIDSEGGGSTLIVTPNDESLLIDTGFPGGRDSGRIVAVAKAAGLSKIDHVAITHWHVDHMGGTAEIAQQIPIGTLHERAYPAPNDPDGGQFQAQSAGYRAIDTKREPLAAGNIIPFKPVTGGPKLEVRVLAADKKFVEPTAEQMKTKNPLTGTGEVRTIGPTDNDNSAVFLLSYGDFRFFDGGDLTWNYEAELVTPYNRAGVVDVYQTNHHGFDVSNNPIFVQSLAPNVIVMNNGDRKGGMVGAFASLKKITGVAARYQIHKSINVPEAENAPPEFVANTDAAPRRGGPPADPTVKLNDGNYIKMSVAPDGKSYTITVPSTGHSRTYATKAK
jgi:competence protein ComEC